MLCPSVIDRFVPGRDIRNVPRDAAIIMQTRPWRGALSTSILKMAT